TIMQKRIGRRALTEDAGKKPRKTGFDLGQFVEKRVIIQLAEKVVFENGIEIFVADGDGRARAGVDAHFEQRIRDIFMDKTFDAFHAMPFTQPETILPKILKYVIVLSI